MKNLPAHLAFALAISASLARPAAAKIIGAVMAPPSGVIQRSAPRPALATSQGTPVRVQPVFFQAPAYSPYASQVYLAPSYGYGGGYAFPSGSVSIGGGARAFSGVSFLPSSASRPVGPRSNAEVTAQRLRSPQLAIPGAGAGVRPDPMLARTKSLATQFQQRYGQH